MFKSSSNCCWFVAIFAVIGAGTAMVLPLGRETAPVITQSDISPTPPLSALPVAVLANESSTAGNVSYVDETPVQPGRMLATLLGASEADRNTMFWQTLRLAGFHCPERPTAQPIGRDGSTWRARCSGTLTYRIEVDGFGRLLATPMPYGDVDPFIGSPVIERGRTLEIQQP